MHENELIIEPSLSFPPQHALLPDQAADQEPVQGQNDVQKRRSQILAAASPARPMGLHNKSFFKADQPGSTAISLKGVAKGNFRAHRVIEAQFW